MRRFIPPKDRVSFDMRICLVSREFAPYYGAGIGTYLASVTRALSRAGHEVHVLTAKLPPGDHVLTIVPRTADGAEVAGSRREVRVTVREGHVAFAWARPGPVAAMSPTIP